MSFPTYTIPRSSEVCIVSPTLGGRRGARVTRAPRHRPQAAGGREAAVAGSVRQGAAEPARSALSVGLLRAAPRCQRSCPAFPPGIPAPHSWPIPARIPARHSRIPGPRTRAREACGTPRGWRCSLTARAPLPGARSWKRKGRLIMPVLLKGQLIVFVHFRKEEVQIDTQY